jgi:hypothetical protein
VTVKLRAWDHALCPPALTAWTRQKYVPGVRPLTTSWVVAGLVESASTSGEKLADRLTCQLWPPLVSLGLSVEDHEIVSGTWTDAPFAGWSGEGAAGVWAAARSAATKHRANKSADNGAD